MNIEELIYEIDDLWKPENLGDRDIYRIKYLTNLIPADVESVVDIGCGGGVFINYLDSNKKLLRLVGVDRSTTALNYVNTEKVRADITSIPFSNNEFDLVTCLEVIEHIPYFNYFKVLQEICRVSKKYILISVPNNQNLSASLCCCPICFTQFNPDFHMRSFDNSKLYHLLDNNGFKCLNTYNILLTTKYIGKTWFLDPLPFRKNVFQKKTMPWFAICPVCGFHGDHVYSKAKISIPNHSNKLKNIIKLIWPKRYGYVWIAALYKKSY